ncbi:MAG: glycosyltransferase family A protein [Pseudomonadota bacterium]
MVANDAIGTNHSSAASSVPWAPPRLLRPLVSVIVTNYNYARFIGDCLSSILAQDYRCFEVIVVDDVSTDGSPSVIRDFIDGHPDGHRVSLHVCSKNGGQMAAFIEGFRLSKGSFVVFVDADDWLFPDFLSTHLEAHLNRMMPAALSCSDEIAVDVEGRLMTGTIEVRMPTGEKAQRLTPDLATYGNRIEGWRRGAVLSAAMDELPGKSGTAGSAHEPILDYVAPNANQGRSWIWTTTSAIMFRRGVLETVLHDRARDIRICADFYLLHFSHLIGGTLLIRAPLGAYRRHGSNNFATSGLIGTGAPSGKPGMGVTYATIWARMRGEVQSRFAEFQLSMGEPQALRLLATLSTPGSFLSAAATVGPARPAAIGKLAVFFAIQRWRRVIAELRRLAHFT